MAVKTDAEQGPRTVASNRKARHDYFIEESFEAGIALTGTEIKSVRKGHVNLRDGFVLVRSGEAWLINVHIAHYEQGNRQNHEETRQRKLLLHKKEIDHIYGQVTQKNWTIVPLRMYINNAGRAKVEIALVRGKHTYDKRDTIRDRDAKREIQRAIKQAF
ncbi:MAG: SsrA-binding protein SmpB [Caldilineaceae bacterium]|nr:SsrA-binding protein SmpB [Caldilineaceae bacterium]